MMKHLLDQPDLERRDLVSLEVLSYGGAPMPFPVIRRAIERFPKSVGFVNAFGQTETTSTLTVLGPEDHRLDGGPADVERTLRRLRSIGRPLPDVEVRIVDDEGRSLGADEVGEIHVRTPRVMKGYAGAKDSPFTAGRLAADARPGLDRRRRLPLRRRPQGRHDHPRRREHRAGRGRGGAGRRIRRSTRWRWSACPTSSGGSGSAPSSCCARARQATEAELVEFCRERLASFKKPEIVRFLPELPKNPMGKVLRRELQALGRGGVRARSEQGARTRPSG